MELLKEAISNDIFNKNELIYYSEYKLTFLQKCMYTVFAGAVVFVVVYLFYENYILSLVCSLIAFKYPKIKAKSLAEKRKNNFIIQFKDLLYSLSSSVNAGNSLENAFRNSLKDLSILYPEPTTDIIVEVNLIISGINLNEPLDRVFSNFAIRTDIDDICDFASVLEIISGKSSDTQTVISSAVNVINDKIEVRGEIENLLTSKKFEAKIMSLAPIGIVAVLSATSADYMYPVFHTLVGRIAMTIAIVIFICCHFILNKIVDIKI